MPLDKDPKRAKQEAARATPNVTLMLTELSEVHANLLSCFQQNKQIEKWAMEIDDVMERIYQAVKEQD